MSYACQVPGCDRSVPIRSTIKSGEYTGLKCCGVCKNKYDKKEVVKKPIPKFKEQSREKRRIEREGLPEFFQSMVYELKYRPVCENCGCRLNPYVHPYSNIAHILSKRTYPSVMMNRNNVVFLCTEKDHSGSDVRSCHSEFDNKPGERKSMPVFAVARARFREFEHLIKEQGKERNLFES